MLNIPVSVILATHQDSDFLRLSIASVLAQQGVKLELLIVGDGAPVGVPERIAQFSDSRIRYIPVPKGGLTKALMQGCDAASHPFIARLDVGDFMLAGRLYKQASILANDKTVGLVSSNFSMYTSEGYYLFSSDYTTESLQYALRCGGETDFSSPAHASVMFSKEIYLRAGGYRSEFYLTQDCDLWTRVLEISELFNIDETLTGGVFSVSGISGQHQLQQAEYRTMVIELRDRRERELETQSILDAANILSTKLAMGISQGGDAGVESASLFFIARCLMNQDSLHARIYWRKFLEIKKWSIKGRLYYWITLFGPKKSSGRALDFPTLEFR